MQIKLLINMLDETRCLCVSKVILASLEHLQQVLVFLSIDVCPLSPVSSSISPLLLLKSTLGQT